MRWEYKRMDLDISDLGGAGFEEQLNRLGSDGWELSFAVQRERHGYSHEVHMVFKRPLAAAAE